MDEKHAEGSLGQIKELRSNLINPLNLISRTILVKLIHQRHPINFPPAIFPGPLLWPQDKQSDAVWLTLCLLDPLLSTAIYLLSPSAIYFCRPQQSIAVREKPNPYSKSTR